ncbi:hypothetical protein ACKKBG_A05615 [Auxenochlorella protothecoides x Auxenochlorella symbiontica]
MSTLAQPLFEPEDVWPGVLMDDDVLESFQASPSASAVQFPLTHQALDDLDQFEINRPPSPGQVLELLSDGVGTSPWGLEAGAVADPGKPDEALGDLVPMARPIHTPTRSADGSAHHQTSSGEDASNMSRYQQSSPASQQDGAAAADEDEAKRAIRMARNRENAHLSRQRKKAQLEGLEQTCSALTGQVRALSTFVGQLTAENELLRRHLAAACTAAGRPLPDLPRAPGPQLVLLPPPAPGAAPVVALSLAQPLSGATVPLAAAPACPAQGSAPEGAAPRCAPGPTPCGAPPPPPPFVPAAPAALCALAPAAPVVQSAAPAAAQAPPPQPAGRRGTKRARRVATGTGTLLLALMSVFLFAGPLGPRPSPRPPIEAGGAARLAQNPGAGALRHAGRALQMMPGRALQVMPGRAAAAAEAGPGPELMGALADLAPLALSLEGGGLGPLDPQSALPSLAEPVFKAWGMPPPGVCRKLHSIEAGSLPLPLDVSRGDLVEFLEGRLGAQGRALSAVAPPLPQPLALLPGEGAEAPRDDPGAAESVGADPSQCPPSPTRDVEEEGENVVRHDWMSVAEPVLLTALSAPAANASNGAGAGAAPGVVVVMLEPGRRLVTYACDDAVPRVAARAA